MTDLAMLTTVLHELRMRRLVVEEVERPTPNLVRVTLGGDDFEGLRSDGPADHVKVFFPAEGETEARVPSLGPDGLKHEPGSPRPKGRDYTPKHDRLLEGKLVLDVVLHEQGVGSDWARRAQVGDTLGIAGPRGSHVLQGAFDGFVLFGDETALPAISNFVAAASAGQIVTAFVDIADDRDRQPLVAEDLHRVTWLARDGSAPGRSDALVDAARTVPLPVGRVLYWAAGEVSAVAAVRSVLVERGVSPAAIESRGYWRRGVEDHQEPHED